MPTLPEARGAWMAAVLWAVAMLPTILSVAQASHRPVSEFKFATGRSCYMDLSLHCGSKGVVLTPMTPTPTTPITLTLQFILSTSQINAPDRYFNITSDGELQIGTRSKVRGYGTFLTLKKVRVWSETDLNWTRSGGCKSIPSSLCPPPYLIRQERPNRSLTPPTKDLLPPKKDPTPSEQDEKAKNGGGEGGCNSKFLFDPEMNLLVTVAAILAGFTFSLILYCALLFRENKRLKARLAKTTTNKGSPCPQPSNMGNPRPKPTFIGSPRSRIKNISNPRPHPNTLTMAAILTRNESGSSEPIYLEVY